MAVSAVGAERLLFGTHAPLFNVRSALLKLEEGGLSAEERRLLTIGNAHRLFGLGED
jgi:predicted TIM-barrel fold metal-dependent hydrolase